MLCDEKPATSRADYGAVGPNLRPGNWSDFGLKGYRLQDAPLDPGQEHIKKKQDCRYRSESQVVTVPRAFSSALCLFSASRGRAARRIPSTLVMVSGVFTPVFTPGGLLTVTSQLREDGQIEIAVQDTGPGLPLDKADEIFNAFFTTKPEGSGMGLAICKSIVESQGGRIWADGNDERGATFHFTLPPVTPSSIEGELPPLIHT